MTYQIVSADGHTVSNTVKFAYQPPAGAAAAGGSETAVCGAGERQRERRRVDLDRIADGLCAVDPWRAADRDGRIRGADADRVR